MGRYSGLKASDSQIDLMGATPLSGALIALAKVSTLLGFDKSIT